ncbi:MAG: arginine--tRNA ligase [Bacteroidetes bacterium]|nr:arginine--tRNA ligase [Bacteroidota bacterium]
MISAVLFLENIISNAINTLYQISDEKVQIQTTRPEFEGDYTFVTFNLTKKTKLSPERLGDQIGSHIQIHNEFISSFNVVKGFLNISLSNAYWLNYFSEIKSYKQFGIAKHNSSGKTIMLEYSSPNTNKPLHLGHIRNNLLGFSVAKILEANGHHVIKVNLVNDRGIHICKSMLAWKKFANGQTPQSTGLKGDSFVGKYYVEFDKLYKSQITQLISEGNSKEEAEKNAPAIKEAQQMLQEWETGNEDVIALWKTMNAWVYEGFKETYKMLGVNFDKIYYESNTYLLGKEVVNYGLSKNIFYKKENGSVAINLTNDGLDEKIVLRSDGTSVYITQDLGTAIERFKEFPNLSQLIYTVGNEQDYHFKVLFKILQKLGYEQANECYHLSYGMVELPEGKMKSREGTVVDADDLIAEMIITAKQTTQELGKISDFNSDEAQQLYKTIGLGALKYFILKVDPKKKMLFNPKESIDFNGHTGPFIQYTHARICSILKKANYINNNIVLNAETYQLHSCEKNLIKHIYTFENALTEAAKEYNPAIIANYCYDLAKLYNRFYHEVNILKEENTSIKLLRLDLSNLCGSVIKNAMALLGIEVPEKM